MDETVMSAVIPMTTPSTVRKDRTLFSRSVSSAIFEFSPNDILMVRRFASDFLSQCLDWIQVCGLVRGIQSKKHAHRRRNRQGNDDRRNRNVHRHWSIG